jgi:hypothetical protein
MLEGRDAYTIFIDMQCPGETIKLFNWRGSSEDCRGWWNECKFGRLETVAQGWNLQGVSDGLSRKKLWALVFTMIPHAWEVVV